MKTLDRHILVAASSLICVIFSGNVFLHDKIESELISAVAKSHRDASELVSHVISREISTGNYRYSWRQLRRGIAQNGLKGVLLVNDNGRTLVDDIQMRNLFEDVTGLQRGASPQSLPTLKIFEGDQTHLFIKVPISTASSSAPQAWTYFLYDLSAVTNSVSMFVRQILLVSLIPLLISFLIMLVVRHLFKQTLSTMELGIGAILNDKDIPKDSRGLLDEYFEVHVAVSNLKDRFRRAQITIAEQTRYKAIAQTTQMVAHDVRKPFSLFKSLRKKLADTSTPDDKAKTIDRFAKAIQDAQGQVETMLNDIMGLDKNNLTIRKPISIKSILEEVLASFSGEAPKKRLQLVRNYCHMSDVKGDPNHLTRVFTNLVSNAFDAVSDGGLIKIVTFENNEILSVEVHNTGSHLTAKECEKVFDPFYTSGKENGTGLGLAICKKFIEELGGKIFAESKNENHVVFVVQIPIEKNSDRSTMTPNNRDLSNQSKTTTVETKYNQWKIIVVDDDPFFRDDWLDWGQGGVGVFSSGSELFEHIEKRVFNLDNVDCVITDYYLDDSGNDTGLSIAKRLRENGYIGSIYLCSDASVEDKEGLFNGIYSKNELVDLQKFLVRHLEESD